MENTINVSHQCIPLKSNYDVFTRNIETILKHLDPGYADRILDDPESVRNHLNDLAGDLGLMLFGVQHHGDLLSIYGKRAKAKQYVIGNPLVAIQMTQHDMRAALYAPLRVIVYEAAGSSYVEYDLPSSLFGQFGNPEVLKVAKSLDAKLMHVITLADQ